MKRILPALLVLALVGCNLPDPQEAARLKTENETLQTQVQSLTTARDAAIKERDDLASRLQQIKDALENLPTLNSSSSATTPPLVPAPSQPAPTPPDSSSSSTPDSSSSSTPDSSDSSTPDSSQAAPTPPDPSTPDSSSSSTPDSSATPALPPVTASPDAPALEKLQKYADDVLTAAQNFKAQTRQEAPNNCLNGYAAGAYNVQKNLELKECSVVAESNGDYRVTARDAQGNSVSLP